MYRTVLRMAWASLTRRITRSFMVVLMICISLWGLLLMQGVYDGMTEQMISNAISFGQIRAIILAESLFMGIAGFLAGALCGGLSLLYFKMYGLDLTLFSEAFEEFGMDAVTYAIIRFDYFITALVAVILATLISAYFPLQILRKSKPVEVINEV